MKFKKLFAMLLAFVMITPTFAFEEIECSTDPAFDVSSCNQCFTGGKKVQWDNVDFLSDEWVNNTENDMLLFKEIQEEPRLINLDPTNVEWTQNPSSQDFWEYTTEFDNLYSDLEWGYVLEAGKKITWLKSKLGYAYNLSKNEAPADSNIGMLVFPTLVTPILADDTLADEEEVHNECVLFTSANQTPVDPEKPTELPETGPAEVAMLAFLAMLLAFAITRIRKQS